MRKATATTLVDDHHTQELVSLKEVQQRLGQIFPQAFPDRRILVGTMATRVVYVFLYGDFIEGSGHYLRPSHVYFFTGEQATKTAQSERTEWRKDAGKPGFRPLGERWYADNSRESIRDDLMRNTMLRLGIAHKQSGIAVTSSKPIWYLDTDFAALFQPSLKGRALAQAIAKWRESALDKGTLQRMALRASGIQKKAGDIFIEMPDGARMRVSAGPSSVIAKDVIEQYAQKHLKAPSVLWLSASDKKAYPQFVELAATVGLRFDLNAELPDVILADMTQPVKFVFCEIVASDGAVTEARREALIQLIKRSRIPLSHVTFVTAYEDRDAAPFKKNFSQLAYNSYVWFRTEPELLVHLSSLRLGD